MDARKSDWNRIQPKRSTLPWSILSAALLIIICWLAGQSDPLSKRVVSRLAASWKSAGGPVFWSASDTRTESKTNSIANGRSGSSAPPIQRHYEMDRLWAKLNEAQEPEATSLLPGDRVMGIPAPELNPQTDLFGFPVANWGAIPSNQTPASSSPQPANAGGNETASNEVQPEQPSEILLMAPELQSSTVDEALSQTLPKIEPLASSEAEMVLEVDPDWLSLDRSDDGIADASDEPQNDAVLQLNPPVVQTSETPRPPEVAVTAEAPLRAPIASTPANPLPSQFNETEIQRQQTKSDLPMPANQSRQVTNAQLAATPVSKAQDNKADAHHTRDLASARSATWPLSRQLLTQLDRIEELNRIATKQDSDDNEYQFLTNELGESELSPQSTSVQLAEANQWQNEVRELLNQMPQSNRLGSEETGRLLSLLETQLQNAEASAENLTNDDARVAWSQAAYGLRRRLAVWRPIYEINSGADPIPQHVTDSADSVSEAIDRVEQELPSTGDEEGWRRFLLLDDLRAAYTGGDETQRTEAAHRFLARLDWPGMNPEHRDWMQSDEIESLKQQIQPWASTAIDYASLLHQIERAESNSIDLVTTEIAHSMQALRYAEHPSAIRLANNLNTYYRNANVRLALSEELMNRLLPEIPARSVPVRTTMLGSRVTGYSNIDSQLAVRLHPNTESWKLTLETLGNVATRSIGRNGPAAISTSSQNDFRASTPIVVKPTEIDLSDTMVDVRGRSRLRGINSKYDGWPLLGTLVRDLAENEYWKLASLSNRIANGRMQHQIGTEVDRNIREKVDDVSDKFSKAVLGPLNQLQLAPKVIDLETTESRLIARYRMAGPWQLAAMTPRPRAPGDSLLSVQLHQSAINNTLEHLVVQEQPTPLEEVIAQSYELLGIDETKLPNELPEDVSILFAKHRPITVEMEQDKVWITLRIVRLYHRDSLKLRNFIVRASYVPKMEGLAASLVRDGHLSISGPRMSFRQRLPVRAIFNKVLSPNREFPLTAPTLLADRVPEGTEITQLTLRDGWIGVAFGPQRETADSVATRPSQVR